MNVKDRGAKGDGATDDSAALVSADAYAAANGYRYLYFPPGLYYAPAIGQGGKGLSRTILVGEGRLTGASYRQVTPLTGGTTPPPSTDLIPSQHLKQFAKALAAGSAKVVIMGDSTSTDTADEIATTEYMWPTIIRRIKADNPGKSISFVNRAVASQTWTSAAGAATSNFPSWYTPTSANWLSLVQAQSPDLLFLNFGMNPDATPINLDAFHTVLDTIAGWTKVPDVVLITNKQTAYDPVGSFGGYPLGQEPRYVAAGFLRTYARAKGLGLIDFNRWQRLMRDGVDPVDQRMQQSVVGVAGLSLPVTLGKTDGDYDLKATFPGQGSSLWSNLTNLTVQIGNRSDNILVLGKDSGSGNLTLQVYEGTGRSYAGFIVGGVPASGAGDLALEVQVKAGVLTVLWNGVQVYSELVPLFGGPFTPSIAGVGSNVAGVSTTVASATLGVSRTYTPTVTDFETYTNTTAGGGNTLNHMNALGIAAIEVPVLQATRFSGSEALDPLLGSVKVGKATNGLGALSVLPVASMANFMTLKGAIAGNAITFAPSDSTDIDVTVEYVGKGAWGPRFGSFRLGSDATAGFIPAGQFLLWKNTSTGTVKFYYNDGGTLKSLTLTAGG
ncbi:hypothetical protein GCM10007887_04210 [Methylobacterium haplocladii]|uniref:Rhamnogalacturonase A/B/Epimerase-like pectate lyase domain-containing protein n=1 Tax=Methylobacterium haplocladii TaxID=1176176 RepID=A0A512ISD5_9HYPH|nr:hypothetical protein MHA02_30040 [Methylobacterium haplocladii]GLS57765.1 hypothetical protein GCM10007887_04210 [Methylobacterium haplocladii]